ncbi:MAG: hypothetical protein WBQ21_06590 [Solirubrobacteraceae bacterium]
MRELTHPPTPEQLDLTRWTASLGAVTPEALAHRLGVSVRSARARLAVAQRHGLLAGDRPLSGRPTLFTATRDGLRACDARGIQACKVSYSNANHLIVCAAVAAALESCYPGHRLTGERELRRDEREHGHPLASARLLGGAHADDGGLHRPDLVLWPDARTGDLPVAVEVELTIKGPRRLVDICRSWARCRTVAGVLYLAPGEVERALLRAIAEARASELVAVLPLSSLPGAEAAIA